MKKLKIVLIAVFVLIFGAVLFFSYPNLNPLYADGLTLWCVIIDAVVLLAVLFHVMNKNPQVISFDKMKNGNFPRLKRPGALTIVVAAAPWAILILMSVFSTVLFHQNGYKNQMPEPQDRKFTSDVQPLDVSQLPVVDKPLATLLADKKLGDNPTLGSQVVLGEPTIQKVDGKLEWVVPLLHSGVFKWLSNMDGTPGYIVVSATDPRDVSYVPGFKIKYQPNAYLFDLLERHVRFAGGFFTGITDYSFEIDDKGRPYWVVTTYHNRAGFNLPEADGVLLVDASTGATTRYSLKNLPGWIDRVQPVSYIMTQITNRGKYIHGIFNFSNKDKFEPEQDSAIVYYNNHCYLYTGLTSVGQDESSIGFILVDMVTKTPYRYLMSGATAYAAQQSAEGKVQNYKYTASFPLITNVDGRPTYFMTLKDSTGLIKQYAFVSVTDYTTVGVGESLESAMADYESGLKASEGADFSAAGAKETAQGSVDRIAAQISGGNTVYYITLTNQPGRIFTAVADLSPKLALTRAGDTVAIGYVKSQTSVITATTFENQNIGAASK